MLLISSLASRKKPDAIACPLPPSIVTLPTVAANEQGPSLIRGTLQREGGEARGDPPEPLVYKLTLRWK